MANVNNFKTIVPEPFRQDKFEVLQKGIYDDPEVNVFINQQKDFAFLYPQPVVDYVHNVPRFKKLNLENYINKLSIYERRFSKISPLFQTGISNLIEIGAGSGLFLKIIKNKLPKIKLSAVELDQNTASSREEIEGLLCYESLDNICKLDKKFDLICSFHVLEHILNPAIFLSYIRQLMRLDSILIIEVPSIFDPLISIYHNESYLKFYFQSQHPFVYSHESLVRLMEHNNFQTKEKINFQRYSLENHLNWTINKAPGGNELFRKIFLESNTYYISELENYGKTDSVIWIGNIRK